MNGGWPRLTPTQALGPRLATTAFVVLGLLNFLMILKTFRKYGADGGSLVELSGSHQIPEGDAPPPVARGRGLSRKIPTEPLTNSPFIGEGSSGAGVNDFEKSGVGQRVSARL